METPGQIVQELTQIRQQSEKGIDLLAQAEETLARLQSEAEKIEASTFLKAQGTVADRTALAKLEANNAHFEADLAKVEMNRIKTKLKHLSESQMGVMAAAKLIELEWRQTGRN